jgi:serine/threonine-protein kinase
VLAAFAIAAVALAMDPFSSAPAQAPVSTSTPVPPPTTPPPPPPSSAVTPVIEQPREAGPPKNEFKKPKGPGNNNGKGNGNGHGKRD